MGMEGRRSRGSAEREWKGEEAEALVPHMYLQIIPRAELDTIKGSFLNRHVSEEASDGYNWNLEGIAIFKVRRQDSIYGEKLIDCGWQQNASFIDKLLRWLTCEGGEDTMSRVCVVA
ncbi:unnamed protein product [Urochloa humidicola]